VLRLRASGEWIREVYEPEVRDLACFEYQTSVVLELYRVRCPVTSGSLKLIAAGFVAGEIG
jgi:hypothetical protein